jgi:hypothetical protein
MNHRPPANSILRTFDLIDLDADECPLLPALSFEAFLLILPSVLLPTPGVCSRCWAANCARLRPQDKGTQVHTMAS